MARYDRSDPNPHVVRLTRAGHHLWALRAKLTATGGRSDELEAIDAALETIWQAKRKLKIDLAAKKKANFAKFKETLRDLKASRPN